jgi:hypothetical protein
MRGRPPGDGYQRGDQADDKVVSQLMTCRERAAE